jgi:hypothetical protein
MYFSVSGQARLQPANQAGHVQKLAHAEEDALPCREHHPIQHENILSLCLYPKKRPVKAAKLVHPNVISPPVLHQQVCDASNSPKKYA